MTAKNIEEVEGLPCLYDQTGDIKDINTLLINRKRLRELLETEEHYDHIQSHHEND